jgi:hypothetical protein
MELPNGHKVFVFSISIPMILAHQCFSSNFQLPTEAPLFRTTFFDDRLYEHPPALRTRDIPINPDEIL